MRNRRIFHHYLELEETAAGLWKMVSGEQLKDYVQASADLLRSPGELADAMRDVLHRWPRSCDAAFTSGGNRVAFLGQAACCLATGSPEGATRVAWHYLNRQEMDEANAVAAAVLNEWEVAHVNFGQPDMFRA